MKRILTPKRKARVLEVSFEECYRSKCTGLTTTSGIPLY